MYPYASPYDRRSPYAAYVPSTVYSQQPDDEKGSIDDAPVGGFEAAPDINVERAAGAATHLQQSYSASATSQFSAAGVHQSDRGAAEARFPGASAEQAIADRARDAGQATGAVSAPEGTGSSEPFQSASATTHARVGMELPPTRGVFASNFSSAQQYLAATAAAQSGRGMTIGDFSSSSASREALAINTRASNPDLRSSDLSMPSSMPPPARQYSRDAYSSDRPAASPSTAFSEQPVSAQLSTGTPVQPGSIGAAPVTPLGMQAVQSSISAALNLRASRPEYEALTANGTRTPLSSTTERFRPSQVPDFEKERLRIRIDELQTLVDRQNGDLQRRNDELLDLQRNHEAFREKFILFREGMRSKTDESDARFRKLEAELKLSQEELARHRGQMDRKLAGDEASTMRAKDLEAKIEALSKEGMELKEQLQVARNNSAEKVLAQKESLLRDLRTRVENQAEVIRSQNAKMAGLEVRAVEAQTLQSQTHSERARADEELLELQRINKDMEMRHASQVAALNQHAGKLGEVTKTLDEERQTVAALRSELEKAQAKQRETEAAAESQDAEAGRLQQRIQMLDQQIQRASATEADLRVKLNAALAAPKADPNQPAMIQDLQARLSQQSQAVENANSNLAARERAVQDLELQVQQLSDEASRQRKTSQHENAVFTSTRQTMQKEIDSLKRKMNDAVASSLGAKAAEDRATQMEQQARGLQARLAQIQEENAGLRQALQAARSAKQDHVQRDSQRMPELEERLGQATATIALLQQQLSRADAGALSGTSGAAPLVLANLQRARDVLLAKLIGNWQKQALGRSFAAWLRSIESFKMDRILMESDKYMSMDSSIDDLLNDALSKRRARSIVASSVSLGGSSIDDDMFQAAASGARPVSGGSVASYGGGSSVSGSLEWMV